MCKWFAVEILMKASILQEEIPLYRPWVRSYMYCMSCFPRLNVVTENISTIVHHFKRVPNVTFHELVYPPYYVTNNTFWKIQLPMMWADNFTTANHILILDVDTPLIMPMRCHHLFDKDEKPIWRSWKWVPPKVMWVGLDDGYFARRGLHSHLSSDQDFMTFFPVVIPRAVLPIARKVISEDTNFCKNCTFDLAFWKHPRPSYGDIIGKTLANLQPSRFRWVHCPQLTDDVLSNECIDFIPVAEHVKHPIQGAHGLNLRHRSHEEAAAYATRLFGFTKRGEIPDGVYHYNIQRSLERKNNTVRKLFRPDIYKRVCGIGKYHPNKN